MQPPQRHSARSTDASMKVPRWRVTSPTMPLSYLTLDQPLRDAQHHVLTGLVFVPLRDRFVARFGQLHARPPPRACRTPRRRRRQGRRTFRSMCWARNWWRMPHKPSIW